MRSACRRIGHARGPVSRQSAAPPSASRTSHLAPEAAVSHRCGMLGDQVSVELGYLRIQVDDRQHAHRELAAAVGCVKFSKMLAVVVLSVGDVEPPTRCKKALASGRPCRSLRPSPMRSITPPASACAICRSQSKSLKRRLKRPLLCLSRSRQSVRGSISGAELVERR
jgi:hypothetical protein